MISKRLGNEKKNAFLNVILGVISQLIVLIFSIIIPKYVIITYGSESNGLLNSVNQIYNYASMLEFGVGTASIMSMYQAISRKDENEINTILSTSNSYYKKTGVIYGIIVVAVSVFYPLLIESSINKIDIFLVTLFTGFSYATNYIIQSKYTIVLHSYGKLYILSSSQMILTVVNQISKIIIMYLGMSIVIMQLVFMLLNSIKVVYIVKYTKKCFPNLYFNLKPNYSLIKESNYVMVHQIANLVFTSTDLLLLSFLTNLTCVSIYSLYNLVINAISSITIIFSNSVNHILAEKYNKCVREYYDLHEKFETTYFVLSFSLYTTTYYSMVKFIELYTKEITDASYVDKKLALLFVTVAVLSASRNPLGKLIDFAKHYKQTQNRVLLEMTINIGSSFLLVYYYGIYGVLLGTVCALLYRINDIILYVNNVILNRSSFSSYKKFFANIIAFMILVFAEGFFQVEIYNYFSLTINSIIIFVLVLIYYLLVNTIVNPKEIIWLVHFIFRRIVM